MTPLVVGNARTRQATARRDIAIDAAFRRLMPADVESSELREKAQGRIRQMVVDPPSHGAPVGARRIAFGKPGQHDADHGAVSTVRVGHVPDMATIIARVRCAIKTFTVAKFVDGAGTVGGPNGDPTKAFLQRLEQLFAQ